MQPLPVNWETAVELAGRYVAALWQTPCHDCWEERGDDIHVSTIAAIYAGLGAAQALVPRLDFSATREAIKSLHSLARADARRRTGEINRAGSSGR